MFFYDDNMFNEFYISIKKDSNYFYFYDNDDLFFTAYAYSMYMYAEDKYVSIFESYILLLRYKTLYIKISDSNNYSLVVDQPYLVKLNFNVVLSTLFGFIIFTILSIPIINILNIKYLFIYLPIIIILEFKYIITIDYFEYHSLYKLLKNIKKIKKKHIIFIIFSFIINCFRPILLLIYIIHKILFKYEITVITYLFPEIKIKKNIKLSTIIFLKMPLNWISRIVQYSIYLEEAFNEYIFRDIHIMKNIYNIFFYVYSKAVNTTIYPKINKFI